MVKIIIREKLCNSNLKILSLSVNNRVYLYENYTRIFTIVEGL